MEVPLELIYIRIRNGLQGYVRKSSTISQKAGVVGLSALEFPLVM